MREVSATLTRELVLSRKSPISLTDYGRRRNRAIGLSKAEAPNKLIQMIRSMVDGLTREISEAGNATFSKFEDLVAATRVQTNSLPRHCVAPAGVSLGLDSCGCQSLAF
jgi:hypothetical protein